MIKKVKPAPPTVSISCGICLASPAEIILPGGPLVCKSCAKKQGFAVRFEISKLRLRAIKKEIERKIERKITALEFADLLELSGKGSSRAAIVSNLLSAKSKRKISARVAESALRLDQLDPQDLIFLLESDGIITPADERE